MSIPCPPNIVAMDWFSNLNYPAIITGTVLVYLIGWLWYSNVLFGKAWMAHYNLTAESVKSGMARAMILGLILTFILGVVVGILLDGGVASYTVENLRGEKVQHLGSANLGFSLKVALLCGLGFILLWALMGAVYNRRPLKIVLIESMYGVVAVVVFALVIAGWNQVF